jgi:hypothetical protein
MKQTTRPVGVLASRLRLAGSALLAGLVLVTGVALTASTDASDGDVRPVAGIGIFAFSQAPNPTISGTPTVGETLTAVTGTWVPTPESFSYQWFSNGAPIAGATAAAYTLTAAEAWTGVQVQVTAHLALYTDTTRTSEGVGVQAATLTNTTPPAVTGIPRVGATLTAQNGTWSATPDSYAYQWFLNGIAVDGATAQTFVPAVSAHGQVAQVLVAASKAGHTVAYSFSQATPMIEAEKTLFNTALPTIDDTTPMVGETLHATSGTWDPADAAFSYAWLANGVPISGATSSSYVVVAGDEGKALSVLVIAAKADYPDATAESAETSAVSAAPPVAFTTTPAPTVTGEGTVGEPLTANPGTWAPTPDSFTYQWLVDGVPVAGATTETYSPVEGDLHKTVTVQVTAHKTGYVTTSSTSAGKEVAAGTVKNTARVTVSGTPKVGETLTAGNGSWTPTPTVYSYQWYLGADPVDGANSQTFTLPASAEGKVASVFVAAQRPNYNAGFSMSEQTGVIAPAVAPSTSASASPTTSASTSTSPSDSATTSASTSTSTSPSGSASTSTSSSASTSPSSSTSTSTSSSPSTSASTSTSPSSSTSTSTSTSPSATTSTTTSTAPTIKQFVFASSPRIMGKSLVGTWMRYVAPSMSPAPTIVKYRWLRNGSPIKGAVYARYKLTRMDRRQVITLRVTYARSDYVTVVKRTNSRTIR